MQPLTDQIAVVTGAGSGIGRAIALELGAKGAMLVLVGRRPALLDDTAAQLAARSPAARICPTDLADRGSIDRLAAKLRKDCDGLDFLVHAAGLLRLGNIDTAPADDFDRLYRTNLLAPFLLTQATLPLLRRRQGQVVFINSSAGVEAKAGAGQYAATKHALTAVADSLRAEVNGDGIRVLSIFAGRTATAMQERLHADEQRTYRPERLLQAEDVAAAVISMLGLPHTAEVTDLHIRPMMKPD